MGKIYEDQLQRKAESTRTNFTGWQDLKGPTVQDGRI